MKDDVSDDYQSAIHVAHHKAALLYNINIRTNAIFNVNREKGSTPYKGDGRQDTSVCVCVWVWVFVLCVCVCVCVCARTFLAIVYVALKLIDRHTVCLFTLRPLYIVISFVCVCISVYVCICMLGCIHNR